MSLWKQSGQNNRTGVKRMTHKQLCTRISLWLKNVQRYTVVATELSTAASETPDVIGWHGMAESILIECKVSRSDFLSY